MVEKEAGCLGRPEGRPLRTAFLLTTRIPAPSGSARSTTRQCSAIPITTRSGISDQTTMAAFTRIARSSITRFYLAIEGGMNRTSGLSVQGVGGANREQIEKVFYRGFTLMLTPNATFSDARAATIQSARDLYGPGSGVDRAVTQAWAAVGVN
jgi:hypothetical protein